MPDTPATNIETAGVYGNAGALPQGSAVTSGSVKDTSEIGAGGSTTARPESPTTTGTLDTEGVYGPNQPSAFTPVSTLLSGTKDTTMGYANNMSALAYRAPAAYPDATIKDTTNALGFTAAVPTDSYPWVTDGTTETAYYGAPGGKIVTQTDTLTIDDTTPALTRKGVIGNAASLTVVNTGQVKTVTDEVHDLTALEMFTLTNNGLVTAVNDVVVKKGTTTLTRTVDYNIVATGSGATANAQITPIDSATVNSGDILLVSYQYGNTEYFTDDPLAITTDYTVTFVNGAGERQASILRVGGGSAEDGDQITVTYQAGNQAYWGTHDPAEEPPAPVIGTAVALDRKVRVVWTTPGLTETDDIDGFLIQSDTGGTRYVPGGNLSFEFENVVPGQSYKFKVAAFNEKGLSAFSALSNAVVPLNYDQVPSGSLDPKNTINPIYNADGTIVAGTGLGV